jgi:hypothetical protein
MSTSFQDDDYAREKSLEVAKDKYAAERLCALMMELSEMHYSAAWLHDLEFLIWGDIKKDEGVQFAGGLSWASELLLKQHAKEAGGWWYFTMEHGELFEPAEEFQKRYDAWKLERPTR